MRPKPRQIRSCRPKIPPEIDPEAIQPAPADLLFRGSLAYSEYQKNAERDQRSSSENAAKVCAHRELSDMQTCIAEQLREFDERQATNQNLQAQQEMVFWAKWMFLATVATALVSGVGLLIIYRTLRATEQTLTATELALKREWPPKLRFRQVVLPLHPDKGLRGHLYLVNEGPSEATKFKNDQIRIWWGESLPSVHPFEQMVYNPLPESKKSLNAGGLTKWHFTSNPDILTAEDYERIESGKIRLFVVCRILYRDELDIGHREITTFSYCPQKKRYFLAKQDEDYNYSH